MRAFYKAISTVTVLDPTCGSGAFLFAALNILQPLYEVCLERMQAFVEDLERSGEAYRPEKFSDFRKILGEVDRHPNRDYFILKSIIINNLYGVDIMEEAVEICKLRLFLKLVAQVERVRDLEPLPDIDFNIRAGNTLVGFTSLDEIKRAAEHDTKGQGKLLFGETDDAIRGIEEDAEIVSRAFQQFHNMQTEHGMDAKQFSDAKQELRKRLNSLTDRLDSYLGGEYAIDSSKQKKKYDQWRISHQPFHWFAEFYGIMQGGGFDVIIGNPPYLERAKLNNSYNIINFKTERCRDIYAWIVERVENLHSIQARIGLIVPVSIVSSNSFDILRNVITSKKPSLWFAHFANRPGQLFSGAQNRLTIFLQAPKLEEKNYSTKYPRWDAKNGEREILFNTLQYVDLNDLARSFHGLYPKLGDQEAVSIFRKIQIEHTVSECLVKSFEHRIFWVRVPGYFCQFFLEPPTAKPEGGGPSRIRGEVISISTCTEDHRKIFHSVFNSAAFFQYYCAFSDGRHINPSDVKDFLFDYNSLNKSSKSRLITLSEKLESSMKANTSFWRKSGLLIDSVDSRPTKPILDKIDCALAKHYDFIDEELDFIINYDIKYRMGLSDGNAK